MRVRKIFFGSTILKRVDRQRWVLVQLQNSAVGVGKDFSLEARNGNNGQKLLHFYLGHRVKYQRKYASR